MEWALTMLQLAISGGTVAWMIAMLWTYTISSSKPYDVWDDVLLKVPRLPNQPARERYDGQGNVLLPAYDLSGRGNGFGIAAEQKTALRLATRVPGPPPPPRFGTVNVDLFAQRPSLPPPPPDFEISVGVPCSTRIEHNWFERQPRPAHLPPGRPRTIAKHSTPARRYDPALSHLEHR